MPPADMSAESLFETNLRGYGPTRLSALPKETLNSLARMCSDALQDPPTVPNDREPLSVILSYKKKLARSRRTTPTPPAADAVAHKGALRDSEMFNIFFINALKLRIDKRVLGNVWREALEKIAMLACVLVMTEVPATSNRAIVTVREWLAKSSGSEWKVATSTPSGARPESSYREVHAIYVREGTDIVAAMTHLDAGGTCLSYAPFTVQLRNASLHPAIGDLVVTSVHLPPRNATARRRESVTQLRAFLSHYGENVRSVLGTPTTAKGARDARLPLPPGHVIVGDFNADASQIADAIDSHSEWRVGLGNCVKTSAGRKSYDNALLSHTIIDHLPIGCFVEEPAVLANWSKGQDGISDHVFIKISIQMPRRA